MLELHQFRHSAFCEKVRLVLRAKRLSFSVVEVTPGLGQLDLFRLSGQRQVPVLVDGERVISDSTTIALHLEETVPEPPLLPADPAQRAEVLLLEDWADTTLAQRARLALLQTMGRDPVLREALLPEVTPEPLRRAVGAIPAGWASDLGDVVAARERQLLMESLEQLAALTARRAHLVGATLSLADLAVAAQLSLLRFPASAGASLAGRGVPGLHDHPQLQPLFEWRDAIEASLTPDPDQAPM
ncbi:glutathione S-transferase family protein [Synechococcus sp. RSCCF101]|uniref:glutathione S-transferase family protein n=1 Tax=Synechococcus sp. RSCCF101 TaxID=2511069 RepID=UPI0012489BE4|nr:glutathione S-transferase family protein [Synechococcus sp. RSCCF101]QEY32920.1 glutathione S-transferase family protein [Synechococcus sp. RSCCF101]